MSAAIPRLELADMKSELANALAPRVERLKYLGEFFKCMGHQPDALLGFIDFTEFAKADRDKRTVETIALTVATRAGNDYERNQHERLSVRLGFGPSWIRAVESLSPDDAPELDARERRVQRFTLAVVEGDRAQARTLLDQFASELGPACAIAMLMAIGRYVVHAMFIDTLDLKPPVPSIFEAGFNGD